MTTTETISMTTSEIVTLIFSGIVAFSTVIYVILTNKLAKETRLSREFQLESNLIAYFVTSETNPDIISLVIKNIGKGVARNVTAEITKDLKYEDAVPLEKLGIFKNGIKFFPPDYELKYFLTSIQGNKEKFNDKVTFKLEYSDSLKTKRKQWFTLHFNEMSTGKHTPPDTYIGLISYRLTKIEKSLNSGLKIEILEDKK